MHCNCLSQQDRSGRQKINEGQRVERRKRQAPTSIKILNNLGLSDFLLRKIVFRKKQSKYRFIQKQKGLYFALAEDSDPIQLKGFKINAFLLEKNELSVPVLYLQNIHSEDILPTIVYSHGNSSDLLDAYTFFTRMVKTLNTNIIIYDYTGYGISKKEKTTQSTLCNDIELVISNFKIPKQEIILWGFSLGTYPTISISSKFQFGGTILQSPIASISFLFDKEKSIEVEENQHYTYNHDRLSNLQNVGNIKGEILILHSSSDEIIPIQHAHKLFNVIKNEKNCERFSFLEVSNITHNGMHAYLAQQRENQLNRSFRCFIEGVREKIQNKRNKIEQERKKPMLTSRGNKKFGPIHIVSTKDYEQIQQDDHNANLIMRVKTFNESDVKNHKVYFAMKNYHKSDIPKLFESDETSRSSVAF